MKARAGTPPLPATAQSLVLSLCGLAAVSAAAPATGDGDIADALHWLARTRASVARLEGSLARARRRLSAADPSLAQGPARTALLQVGSKGQGGIHVRGRPKGVPPPCKGTKQAVVALDATLSSLETLEKSMAIARRRLSRAERAAVNGTVSAPHAYRELLRIQRATAHNAAILKNLTASASTMNLTLTKDGGQAWTVLARASDLSVASGGVAGAAQPGGAVGKALGAVKAQGSSQKDLKALLQRVQTLEAEEDDFDAKLGGNVRGFLVRRLRRGSREVRAALRKVSEAAPPLLDPGPRPAAALPPLGVDLGLADDA